LATTTALQIEKTKWHHTLAGCKVKVYEHLDGTISLSYGPHLVGRYSAAGAAQVESSPQRRLNGESVTQSPQQKQLPHKDACPTLVLCQPGKLLSIASLNMLGESIMCLN